MKEKIKQKSTIIYQSKVRTLYEVPKSAFGFIHTFGLN